MGLRRVIQVFLELAQPLIDDLLEPVLAARVPEGKRCLHGSILLQSFSGRSPP